MLTENQLPENVPCFLCSISLDVRIDKKNHPYFICDDCGVQTFVRGPEGIKKMTELSQDKSIQKLSTDGGFSKRAELKNIEFEIQTIKKELWKIPWLFPTKIEADREKLLRSKLKALEAEFQTLLSE